MLDSPAKNISAYAASTSRIIWRGSDWLLVKPESLAGVTEENSSPSPQPKDPSSSQHALAELSQEIQSNERLSARLHNTLTALESRADRNSSPQQIDINKLLQRVSTLIQSGNLQWLPSGAKAVNDSQVAITNGNNQHHDGLKEKKTLQKPAAASNTTTGKRKPASPKPSPVPRKPGTVTSNGRNRGKQFSTAADSTKSLIDWFTHADAETGKPISRWLTCAGRVPVAEIFTTKGGITAKFARKTTRKPGKLGNGRISPKNPRHCDRHCAINLVSGEERLVQTDFELPGPIPLLWQRTYRTSHHKDFGLGPGWTSPLLCRLELRENEIVYHDGDGRDIPFERVSIGESCHNVIERLSLYCDDNSVYRIVDSHNGTPAILTFGGSGKRRRLYEVADRHGHAIKLFYSANDHLIQILDSAGRRLKIHYAVSDQIQRIFLCDDQGEISGKPLVEYAYNGEGELVQVIDANGNAQTFEYRYHVITKHSNKDGFNFHFQWDEYTIKGKCTRTWGDNDIYHYRFKYDEVNKITRSTDAYGHTAEYHYNDLGLITTHIDPEGGVSQFTYNSEGQLLSERNPIGNTAHYHYDTHGRMIRKTDTAGAITEYQYDGAGNLVTITAPMERVWERQYDSKGNIASSKDPAGYTTYYQFNPHGWVSAITDCLGRTRQFEWNDKGELVWQSDAAGNKTHYVHDALGRITKITTGDQRTTHYSYDRMNSVTQIILPSGASIQMQYTPQGNLIQYIDAVGKSTRYKYDGLNQPTERIDPSGLRMQYEYDKLRNLTAVINENAERCELQYDKNQRLIVTTGFDGRAQKYSYNAAGQLVRYVDGAHRVTSFKRDPMGRLLQKRTSTGEITQYEYDAAGQLTKAYNNHSVLHFRYDGLGQLIGEMQNQHRIQHRYNAPGQRTHTIMPNGRTVRYDYDERGLVNRISYSGRVLGKVTRDPHGQQTHRTAGEVSSRMEYDAMGRLRHQQAENDQGRLLDRTYRYDKAGNLRQIDDGAGGRLKLHYDTLDRLQKVESSLAGVDDELFTFDPAGNLLDDQYPEPEGFVQGNRLRVFHNYRFEYDDVGNLVRQFQGRLETRFYYNVANQLVRAHKTDQTFEYAYDPLGRRIKKRSDLGQTVYLWDGERLIGEQFSEPNEEPNEDRLIIYLYEPDRDTPLCQIREGEIAYFHTDQQGTPLIITTMDGKKIWQARYKAYGSIAQLQADNMVNPICFHGHYHDTETGLLYGRQRYYHPVIGRYVQQERQCLHNRSNHYLYNGASTLLSALAVPNGLHIERAIRTQGHMPETIPGAPIAPSGHIPGPMDSLRQWKKPEITPQSMAQSLSVLDFLPQTTLLRDS